MRDRERQRGRDVGTVRDRKRGRGEIEIDREKMRGGRTTLSRTSAGLATTVLDTAFALHLPAAPTVRYPLTVTPG